MSQQQPSVTFRYHRSLITRCQRVYGWTASRTRDVARAYQQFMFLKMKKRDFDATVLSPPPLVDSVWHQHLLDPVDYFASCQAFCGEIIGHDPDGMVDEAAREVRRAATREAMRTHLAGRGDVDADLWSFEDRDMPRASNPPAAAAAAGRRSPAAAAAPVRRQVRQSSSSLPPPAYAEGGSRSPAEGGRRSSAEGGRRSPARGRRRARDLQSDDGDDLEIVEPPRRRARLAAPVPPAQPRGRNVRVYVLTLDGARYRVDVPSLNTLVREVAQRLMDNRGIPVDQQRLIFQGRQIFSDEDGEGTLADYNVRQNSELHLILRLRAC